MKKILLIIVLAAVIVAVGYYIVNRDKQEENEEMTNTTPAEAEMQVLPVSHATMMLVWNNKIIYTDPVGSAEQFAEYPNPDLILVTDIHSDHLSAETLQAVAKPQTTIIAPQAVLEQLPESLRTQTTVMANGQTLNAQGFAIEAIPMYNLPESTESFHARGRGNGYVIEAAGERVYISGDTSDIPEMRTLQNIDTAFVAMNLPYTMSVDSAASAVLDFKPTRVYPYHYRGQDGLSDVNKFKQLVTSQNNNINVVLLNWYPQ